MVCNQLNSSCYDNVVNALSHGYYCIKIYCALCGIKVYKLSGLLLLSVLCLTNVFFQCYEGNFGDCWCICIAAKYFGCVGHFLVLALKLVTIFITNGYI